MGNQSSDDVAVLQQFLKCLRLIHSYIISSIVISASPFLNLIRNPILPFYVFLLLECAIICAPLRLTCAQELTGEFKVESQLTDQVSCGATLAVGDANELPVKNVFARVTDKVLGRSVKADVKVPFLPYTPDSLLSSAIIPSAHPLLCDLVWNCF